MSGEPLALLATVMLPVTAPVAAGANFTESVAVPDGSSVVGGVIPLTLKPLPAAVMLVICIAAVPVLVSVMFCEVLLPVDAVPKLKLVGFATNCPVAVVDPVPLRVTFVVGLVGSLLVIAMFPLALPADVGEKVTDTGTVCPVLIVFGVVIPLIPNSAPLIVIMEIIKSAEPTFVSTKFAVPLLPTVTLPKLSDPALTDSCG